MTLTLASTPLMLALWCCSGSADVVTFQLAFALSTIVNDQELHLGTTGKVYDCTKPKLITRELFKFGSTIYGNYTKPCLSYEVHVHPRISPGCENSIRFSILLWATDYEHIIVCLQ